MASTRADSWGCRRTELSRSTTQHRQETAERAAHAFRPFTAPRVGLAEQRTFFRKGSEITTTSRFDCAASSLRLTSLLSKTRHMLSACLAVGVGVHLLLARIAGFEPEQRTIKPLTTHFIKRQPRLSKPLELKKRPQPKRRQVRRQMVSVKARVSLGQHRGTSHAAQVLPGIARPEPSITRIARLGAVTAEPLSLSATIAGGKEAEQRIDMSLELLDIRALDTGKYHAMIIEDPTDKRNIRGFFHLALVPLRGVREGLARMGYNGAVEEARWRYGLRRLVQAVNRYTHVEADLVPDVPLSSEEAFKVPWLYACSNSMLSFFDESEIRNIGEYLTRGGFVFFDAGINPQCAGYISARAFFERAFGAQGLAAQRDWNLIRLPDSHPVYHCFFDFNGPPAGGDFWNIVYRDDPSVSRALYAKGLNEYLEGYESADGHLYGILSLKLYYQPWADFGHDSFSGGWRYEAMDPTRGLQFGVNLIVFALTQEGSITRRVMDTVR